MKSENFLKFSLILFLLASCCATTPLTVLQFIQSIRDGSSDLCVVALIGIPNFGEDDDFQERQPQVIYTEFNRYDVENIQPALQSSLTGLHYLRCLVSFELKSKNMYKKGIANLYGLIGGNDRSPLVLFDSVFFNFIHENDFGAFGRPPAINNGPIFLVAYIGSRYSADAADIKWLYYFCWFCVEPKLKPIYLPPSPSLTPWPLRRFAELATDGGKNITWQLSRRGRWSQEGICAQYGQRCEVEQLGAVLEQYVMAPFQESKPGNNKGTAFAMFSKHPCLTEYIIPLPETPVETVYFITADGVHKVGPTLGGYLQPFQSIVWMSTYLCIVVLSAGLALTILKDKQYFLQRYAVTFIWLLRILLGQRDSSPLPESTSKYLPHSKRILILSWLLTAFMLRTAYKQLMPIRHVEPSVHTKWIDLEFMENFTFFIPLSDPRAAGLLQNYELKDDPYEEAFICTEGERLRERTLCPIFKRLHLARRWGNRHMKVSAFMKYEAHSVIVNELTRPKTAIVTTRGEFQGIWRVCEQLMLQPELSVMFALSRSPNYYSEPNHNHVCISTNLDRPLYNRIIHRRLMSAISYGMINRWENAGRATAEEDRGRYEANTNDESSKHPPWTLSDALFIINFCGILANFACIVYLIELLLNINKPDKRGPKPVVILPMRMPNHNVGSVETA